MTADMSRKMKTVTTIAFVLFAIGARAQAPALRIVVIEGEDAVNVLQRERQSHECAGQWRLHCPERRASCVQLLGVPCRSDDHRYDDVHDQ